MDDYSITQNGKPLDESLYTIDYEKKVFTSDESYLVLDFTNRYDWTFTTVGHYCTFITGWNCTFHTGYKCIFNTSNCCTFTTGYGCTFKTDWHCTFRTASGCTFDTADNCTFKTTSRCTFRTGWDCTFETGDSCTFKTDNNCTFQTSGNCIFSLYKINTCKFKSYDGYSSTILDRNDNKHYLLTKEFVQLRKIANG